jgi:hypothetical protein
MPCPLCLPWNQPLVVRERQTVTGAVVALRYEEWIWYDLHVVKHQAGNWKGEIESYTLELLAQTQESVVS